MTSAASLTTTTTSWEATALNPHVVALWLPCRVQVMSVAKDQNGCRFLQRKFDEGGPAAIQAVLPEVLEHLIDLMMDPFGNYLIQKLLDRCSEEQRLAVRAPFLEPFVGMPLVTNIRFGPTPWRGI